jgi:murein L,D-transpeptidase YcbB/YkuD
MWASGAKIIGTSVVVLTLQTGVSGRAETPDDGRTAVARHRPDAALAAVLPLGLSRAAVDGTPDDSNGSADIDTPLHESGEMSARPSNSDAAEKTRSEQEKEAAETEFRSKIGAALKARLETRAEHALSKEQEAIAAFYVGREFAPLWFVDGKPIAAVAPAMARIRHAADDALDLEAFPLPGTAVENAEAIAAADIALTDAIVAYGRQASGSRVDPGKISRLIGARPEVADAAIILALVASAGERAGETLRGFNPPHPAYAALRQKLEILRRQRTPATSQSTSIPTGPVLRVGMHDPRVPLVRARLSLGERRGEGRGEVTNSLYDTKIAAAVASFQKANGLEGSGTLTPQTVAVLSRTHLPRIEAEIIANMERWRWMPRDLGGSRIEVNIPDFEAIVIDNQAIVQRHRVVVGKEKTPTPVFSEEMRYLIVNPYWNVPPSIIKNELTSSSGRLTARGFESFYRNGQLVVRQPPGERNALGRIKFMFPNPYAVYMHDTPSRALFNETRRAYSHGCVRVDEPFRFAETVLGKGWSEARLRKLIGGKERYVNLPKPLPVHIQYFTTYVDDAGELQSREDIYGYSRRVRAALGLEG